MHCQQSVFLILASYLPSYRRYHVSESEDEESSDEASDDDKPLRRNVPARNAKQQA